MAHQRSTTTSSSSLPAVAEGRERTTRERLFLAGGALFFGYYLSFWLAGIYTLPSFITGLVMALGLATLGFATPRLPAHLTRAANVFLAVLLGVGATISAALSEGSQCVGFHVIWALPLVYGLFVRHDWLGSATIAVLSLLGGLGVLVHDEVGLSRVAQWLTLSVSAGLFAFVRQRIDQRNLELTLAEAEQVQARLAVADRMASIGMLAAGVAHEINNPMTFVVTNVEFAAERLATLPQLGTANAAELNEALKDALAGCDRVTAIVRTLSRLSRSEGLVTRQVDLNQAITDVVKLSRRELDPIATVKFLAGDVKAIQGDPSRLGQVILNLLVNGAHAVEQRPDGPRTIEVRTFARPPEKVVVEVSDTGCGIDPAHLSRIFEPFFTTKPLGKGTGLGLSLCAEIVEQHAGTIEVESTRGQGSTFRVVLPSAAS